MKYNVVDLKVGNLFVNQNGVKNRVACMTPTEKNKKQKQNNDRKNLFLLLQSTGLAWESGYLCRGEEYTEYTYRPLRTSRLKRVQSEFKRLWYWLRSNRDPCTPMITL